VLRLWPSNQAGQGEHRPESEEIASSTAAILVTPAGADPVADKKATPSAGEQRPQPTDRAVRQFMRDRVATWPDATPAPTEKEDWQAATVFFAPGLNRDKEFRLVRREETPDCWRKQGRRRPWGEAKLSAP